MKPWIHATVFMLIACLLGAGCANNDSVRSAVAEESPVPYVQCLGELVSVEAEYPWFENWTEEDGSEVYGDGVAPRATFRVMAPPVYANRIVGILYKYEGDGRSPVPAVAQKGALFAFQLPEDFLTGNFETIDNSYAIGIKAVR